MESGFKENTISKNKLIDFLKCLFPNSALPVRNRSGTSNQTVYTGTTLKPLCEELNRRVTFTDILQYAPHSMQLVRQSDTTIEYNQDLVCLCNGNKVIKELTFHSDGHFTVILSGKEPNLGKLNVDNTYQLSMTGASTVFKIFHIIRLFNSQMLNKNVSTSRYHTLENWTYNGETFRYVFSLTCLKAVSINSKNMTCRVCQQQVRQSHKESISSYQPNDENDTELGRRNSIQKPFPSAPTKMINFLVE